jgi:DNA integrity scanning protein DisA with diadenylate cyclase activity
MAFLQDMLPTILQQNNLLLLLTLIILFILAYKIMKTVVQTAIISLLSGVFLVVLNMVGMGPELTFSRFMSFMVLGAGLFMLYSTLATATNLLTKIWQGIFSILSSIWTMLTKLFGSIANAAGSVRDRNKQDNTSKGKETRDVILKEMNDDE